ncbi:RuBisCO-associated protein [Senna tora]|uniref:RuBisCO-associated protein n=1 Tax=Senna tora TaxID=362788 RepID=A0A835CM92_9FABA|nr:RuBisCO-associated protein [Senna tora]
MHGRCLAMSPDITSPNGSSLNDAVFEELSKGTITEDDRWNVVGVIHGRRWRYGGHGDNLMLYQVVYHHPYCIHEVIGISFDFRVANIDAIETILLDDALEGYGGVADPPPLVGHEEGVSLTLGMVSDAQEEIDWRRRGLLEVGDVGGSDIIIIAVEVDAKFSVLWCPVFVVVSSKGQNDMRFS